MKTDISLLLMPLAHRSPRMQAISGKILTSVHGQRPGASPGHHQHNQIRPTRLLVGHHAGGWQEAIQSRNYDQGELNLTSSCTSRWPRVTNQTR